MLDLRRQQIAKWRRCCRNGCYGSSDVTSPITIMTAQQHV